MKINTDTIDALFLELSQFTKATTGRELKLLALNSELLKALNDLLDIASGGPMSLEEEKRAWDYASMISSKANKLI